VSGTNILGPLVTMSNVRAACEQLARDYIAPYLGDAARAEGKAPDWIAPPASYRVAREVMKWPESQTPALIVAVPGTSGAPRQRGSHDLAATWAVTFGAIVAGTDDEDTDAQASIYEAAMRAMVLKQGGNLPPLDVERVTWTGSAQDPVPQHDQRYILAASVNFDIEIAGVANSRQGFLEPPEPPLGDLGPYPTADTVDVTLAKTPT
jgi:hypothetical protein